MASVAIGMWILLPTDPYHTPALARLLIGIFSLVGTMLAFGYILISTIYPFAIFLDTKTIRQRTQQWRPNPYLYGGLGLLIYGNPLLQSFKLFPKSTWVIEIGVTVMTLYYLVHRFRYSSPEM